MNQDTLFYRQIHDRYVKPDGHVASIAFRPLPKDEHMLSVYDGDKIDPMGALVHFTETRGFTSVGILAVSGAECDAETLPRIEDYSETNPYHVLVDFSGKNERECRKISERLRNVALRRGWLAEKQ